MAVFLLSEKQLGEKRWIMNKRHSASVVLLLALCFLGIFLFCSCDKDLEPRAEASTISEEVVQRDYLQIDIGEIPEMYSLFFPSNRVAEYIVSLTSVSVEDALSNVEIEGDSVKLNLLPIRSQLGKSLSGEVVLENIRRAYDENSLKFSANLIDYEADELLVSLTFDDDIDLEKELYPIPLYPLSLLEQEDRDSYGNYLITKELDDNGIELYSNTLEENKKIVMAHYAFESACEMFDKKELDILYLPSTYSAKCWGDLQREVTVCDVPGDYVYMVAFGEAVPKEQRLLVKNAVSQGDFIASYLGGRAVETYYPASNPIIFEEDEKDGEASTIFEGDSLILNYICFVDSQWSYDFHHYLSEQLAKENIFLDTIYTDFENMLSIAKSEDSDYIYAFAWKENGDDISILLGDGFGGDYLSESQEALYAEKFPAFSIAKPYERYVVSKEIDASFLFGKSIEK